VLDSGYPTAISLFYHVTFAILAIAAINLWVEKRWPRAALSGGEIMTIYLMLAVAGAFCSHDLLQILVPMLAYPYYNANPQNNWQTLILQYLKPWAVPHDPRVLAGMAVGNSSIYRWTVLGVWLRPLAFWFAFLMVMTGALLSLNLFFRQQWTENERLSYPIIHIPMMIATGLRDLLRSRLFWIAFGVAAAIDVVNGFNYLFPSIPRIPIQHAFEFRNYFVERPWNAIANTFINLTPFAIGLTFFIPIDLAFSCWFFFLLYRLELVTAAAIGLSDLPGFPFPRQQGAGGYIALGLLALWGARRHLAAVARTILGRPGGADESHEPLRYRTALLVFIVCFAALVAMGCALGARLPVMVFFFVVFMLYSLAIARMRAELGPPGHDLHNAAPNLLITDALGTHNLGKGDLATFSLFFWFNRAYRAHFSAHSMEGFKIAQLTRITNRAICGAMILASVLGSVVALWAILHLMMVHGYSGRLSGEAYSNEPWNLMASMVSIPLKPNMAATMATVTGIVTALALGALRMKFTWWMWHPVGYATSMSWSMDHLWFCMFLGWLAKLLITRYGGAPAYRKAMPFFVGLVLGEFVVGSLWGIWGALAGHKVYCFWGL
ncbi:MAG: hypothetical protein M1457_14410, partial [bacterium]|nr:hypothetical protein [bacterium]